MMHELLPSLLARGISGRASTDEARVLALLANPGVNRYVFGQPPPDTSGYYLREWRAHLTATQEPVRQEPR